MNEFIPGKINDRADKAAAEASSTKEEQKAQTTGSPQPTQAMIANGMFEGKLVLIIGILWLR
jgi:hypothetical protein